MMSWTKTAALIQLCAPHERVKAFRFAAKQIAEQMLRRGHGIGDIERELNMLVVAYRARADLESRVVH
jgi:hypothetical protein